jgi:CRISPR-associated protein Cas1
VSAKIRAQAACMTLRCETTSRKLLNLASEVRAGDAANVEAQAARVYWQNWLKPDAVACLEFRRRPATEGGEHPNAMLDYGYAVVRALVARALVSRGLLPCIGIHHRGRGNPFNLADDLMEPLRPIVDARVRFLFEAGHTDMTPATKRELLPVVFTRVTLADGAARNTGPLQVMVDRMCDSFVAALEGGRAADGDRLCFPAMDWSDGQCRL